MLSLIDFTDKGREFIDIMTERERISHGTYYLYQMFYRDKWAVDIF